MSFAVVIPARYGSTRLPGKPLLDIAGKPMVQRVWEQACSSGAAQVIVATDDPRIEAAAREFGAEVCMTDPAHPSGTDRLQEVAAQCGWEDDHIVVNVQGDEPLMPPACLEQAASVLANAPESSVSSLYWPIEQAREADNPNAVKVVVDEQGYALYFSRSPIPYPRGYDSLADAIDGGIRWKRHIGLYAYRAGALKQFTRNAPSALEQTEKLEQLRFLENGSPIIMAQACQEIPAGVDTPEDLERVRKLLPHSG